MLVFIDIKKAFDSVPHQTLLNKVSSLNIPFILHQWLTNYLRSRLQRVVLSGAISLWLPVKSDVPQGSVLGPCFFFCPTLTTWPSSLSLMAHEYCYLVMAICFINRYLMTRILSISREMWILLPTGPNSITWN